MRFIQIANLLFLSAYIFSALTIGTALIMGGASFTPALGGGDVAVAAEQGPDDMIILAQNTH